MFGGNVEAHINYETINKNFKKGKVGLEKESTTNFENQNFSDGKLEFLNFSSAIAMRRTFPVEFQEG